MTGHDMNYRGQIGTKYVFRGSRVIVNTFATLGKLRNLMQLKIVYYYYSLVYDIYGRNSRGLLYGEVPSLRTITLD